MKQVKYVINGVLVLVLVGFIVAVCLQRFSDNKIAIFNYRLFSVITGSMEPKYMIGDILIAKDVNAAKIKVGDAICYEGKQGFVKDKIITHQVVKKEQDERGKYLFHTKGLVPSAIEDPIVDEEQLYGVIVYKMKLLSLIAKIVKTQIGFYLFIIIPLMYVICAEIITMLLAHKKRQQGLED